MERGELKRGKPPKRKTKLKARSDKTAARDELYKERREIYLAANRRCVAAWDGCTREATDVHHAAGRWPSVFFDEGLWRALCRNCHTAVESQRERAYDEGLLVHRYAV